MTATTKNPSITAAALGKQVAQGAVIRVLVEEAAYGKVIPARRKTGVVTARVLAVHSKLVRNPHRSGPAFRIYEIQTSAGIISTFPVQTFWLAPEDSAAVKRAHAEAAQIHADLFPAPAAPDYISQHIRATAARHAVKARMDRDYAAAEAAAQQDDLDAMKFAELMVIAKALKVPGRGVARAPQLREGIRAARAAA